MPTSIKQIGRLLAASLGIGLLAILPARGDDAQRQMEADSQRVVSQYKTVMERPPWRVPSRDVVDGPLLGNGSLGAVISGPPEAQRYWISKNNFWRLKDGHRQGGPRGFGGLEINMPALAGGTYLVEQEFFPAITTSRFTKSESTVTIRSWVAATEDFLLVELSVEGKPIEVQTRLWAAPGRGSKEALGRNGAILWATKQFSEIVKIPTAAACALAVIGDETTIPALEPVAPDAAPTPPRAGRRPPLPKPKSQPGPKFTLRSGRRVIVAVAMQSSFDARPPLPAAEMMARELSLEKVDKLLERHRQWWREFWAHSLVEIGDPLLEKNYYAANYVIGSAMRDPEFPTGLFGLWVTSDDPRWGGDYHLNFDYQSQYYALYACNLLQQADTFEAPVLAFMDRGRWYAQNLLGLRGVYYSVGIGPKGIETCRMGRRTNASYQEGGCFMGQKTNAAYCLVNMAMRWYHTYDKQYARKVYPFVLEVANFWEGYLRFEGGRYVIHDDSIQENSGPDFNSIVSLALVRNTFELALDMSSDLGADAGRRTKWRHILEHLSAFATQERHGKTVFRYTEKGVPWNDGNSLGIQHIYPAGAIGLDSDPKLLEISRNMIAEMGRWTGNNGENSFYPAAVRVGYDPAVILDNLKRLVSTSRKTANGLPETTEQCSTVPNTINEMLCMSHGQVLRVFPVWPKDRDARFANLRQEGAFLVSSQLKGGRVQYVKIHSERGRDCTLVNPWPGKALEVSRDGKASETVQGQRILMKTEAGGTYLLTLAAPARPARDEALRLTIDAKDVGAVISPLLFGHNLEVTRRSLWRGLGAEMVANRKFAAIRSGVPAHWYAIPGGSPLAVDRQTAFVGHWAVRLGGRAPGGLGQQQESLAFRAGTRYAFRWWLKTEADRIVRMRIVAGQGGGAVVEVQKLLQPGDWQLWSGEFVSAATAENARLEIASTTAGVFWIGAASVQPADAFHGMRRDVIERLKQIQPGGLRFPGGCYAEFYHWQDGMLPVDRRPPVGPTDLDFLLPDSDQCDTQELGTDEFVALCREIGCQPALTMRLSETRPEDAAAWVEYCNGSPEMKWGRLCAERGHPAPYRVKTWLLGNELYYFGRGGMKNAANCARQSKLFAEAMKNVDASVALVGCTFPEAGWNRPLLEQAGPMLRCGSVHDYCLGAVKAGDAEALGNAPMRHLRPILQKAHDQLHIPLVLDEWNTSWGQPGTVGMGLYAAGVLNLLCRDAETLGVEQAYFFQPVNEGAIKVTPLTVELDAAGKIFAAFKVHQGNRLLKLRAADGTRSVPATFLDADLDVCASASTDGRRVYATIVNRSAKEDRTLELRVTNMAPAPTAAAAFLVAKDAGPQQTEFIERRQQPAVTPDGRVVIQAPRYGVVVLELNRGGE